MDLLAQIFTVRVATRFRRWGADPRRMEHDRKTTGLQRDIASGRKSFKR
jgi:hypothetical protein